MAAKSPARGSRSTTDLRHAKLGALLAGALLFGALSGHAERFPPTAHVVRPTDYGAIPNDGLDDTAAFQAAKAVAIQHGWMMFIENGVWNLSDQLRAQIVTATRTITATSDTTPVVVTSPGHGVVNGGQVYVNGTGIAALDRRYWRVSAPTADTFALTDAVAPGATSTTGTAQVLKWVGNWIVHCESPAAVLKMEDNHVGFQFFDIGKTAGQGVISTGSTANNQPNANATGGGNEAFRNHVHNCTIDVGAGNPGAVGINWHISNRGALRNVKIVSSDPNHVCAVGVYMGRPWPGPGLIENVEVDGCTDGIQNGHVQYDITFRNITCRNQPLSGTCLRAAANSSHVENLTHEGPAPGIIAASGNGQLTLIGATITGGSPTKSALEIGAKAYVRDVTTSGYQSAIKQGFTVIPGMTVDEWVSHPGYGVFDAPAISGLRLPVEPPPAAFWSDDPNDWANALDYGANSRDGNDDRAAVQAALNSGKPIVFLDRSLAPGQTLPGGTCSGCTLGQHAYRFSGPVTVPRTVKRIIGGENSVQGMSFPTASRVWLFDDPNATAADATTIGHFWAGNSINGSYWMEQRDARSLQLRDVTLGGGNPGLLLKPGAGKNFWMDTFMVTFKAEGAAQRIWAWALNTESAITIPGSRIEGGTFRVLGWKTEGLEDLGEPTLTVTNGGSAEVLGGFFMPCNQFSGAPSVGFRSIDSNLSLSYTNWCSKVGFTGVWSVQVEETRNGETRQLLSPDSLYGTVQGGTKVWMPLYSGRGIPEAKQALFVVGNPAALTTMEQAMVEQLEGTGHVVTTVDDAASVTADADGKDVLLLSGSVSTAAVGTKFRDVPVGAVVCEPVMFDDTKMSMTALAYGQQQSKTQVSIVQSHPLSAGLPAGPVTVYTAPARVGYGRAIAPGTNVATVEGSTTVYGVFGYETGDTMEAGIVAPARRVGCWIDELAPALTAQGWQLFDSMIQWAAD